ncbi:MerR family transcriptional regulator [Streptomyces daqingensis]|uniref:MerR family transcriptional regulator n=1 Tax=Streptomyces daqingensis TaxID=1472640 RepID=A0ABQ2MHS8_9ACTN|nr:MerR family transcriptional regulator [Streptomyces daqingensis]GGO52140.1 MerR family transcriptional regulator [Streptomyces daqingensis]
MRIGELAALVGVSTRTVRHYHGLGLLPEPVRLSNGYRDYRLRDAVALARVRRLAELGLSLDEIRDVLADDRGRDLREVLMELDADLARQQETIGARRKRLAALLAEAEPRPDVAVSPEMAEVLRELPAGGSQFAELDREMLTLVCGLAGPEEQEGLIGMLRPLTAPAAVARAQALYERLDGLAGAAPDDPRVARLADDLAAHIPDEAADLMRQHLADGGFGDAGTETPWNIGPADGEAAWLESLSEELDPAQLEVFRRFVARIQEGA